MAKSKVLIKSKKGRPAWQYKYDYMDHYLATPIVNDGTKRSYKEAENWALDRLSKKDTSKPVLFKDFTEYFFTENCKWLKDRLADGRTISPVVLDHRKSYLEKYILPFFKKYNVQDIGIAEVKDFKVHLKNVNSLKTKKPLASQTICHILGALSLIMQWAEVKKLIDNNPVPKAGQPAIIHQRRDILSEEELIKIFPNSIEEMKTIWGDLEYAIAAFLLADTGARRSEILALQWKHINLEKGYIVISQAIKAGCKIIGTTKSNKSRAVALRKRSIVLLNYWRDNSFNTNKTDFVFPGKIKGRPLYPNTITNIVKKVFIKVLNVKEDRMLCTHSFRHTAVSMQRRIVDKDVLKYQIGHSSDAMQDEYDEFTPSQIIESYIDQGKIKKE